MLGEDKVKLFDLFYVMSGNDIFRKCWKETEGKEER